ncbi:hypothetical protein D3C75_830720 [compost metagenome]
MAGRTRCQQCVQPGGSGQRRPGRAAAVAAGTGATDRRPASGRLAAAEFRQLVAGTPRTAQPGQPGPAGVPAGPATGTARQLGSRRPGGDPATQRPAEDRRLPRWHGAGRRGQGASEWPGRNPRPGPGRPPVADPSRSPGRPTAASTGRRTGAYRQPRVLDCLDRQRWRAGADRAPGTPPRRQPWLGLWLAD